jgi:hypothetical protein
VNAERRGIKSVKSNAVENGLIEAAHREGCGADDKGDAPPREKEERNKAGDVADDAHTLKKIQGLFNRHLHLHEMKLVYIERGLEKNSLERVARIGAYMSNRTKYMIAQLR